MAIKTTRKESTKPKAMKVAAKTTASKTIKVEKQEVASNVTTNKELKPSKPKGLSTDVYTVKGSKTGTITLPEQFFGAKVNKQLISQAIRVYLANQREGSAFAKTRGQVEGSSRKIFKQKGTGNARHGNIRAPIFVGGGKALGPVPHSFRLELPKKMKVKAVASALSHQYNEGSIKIVDNMKSLELKTKAFVQLLTDIKIEGKTLVLLSKEELSVRRIMRNVKQVDVLPVSDVNTYVVMNHKHILFSKEAIAELSQKN